MIPKNILLAFQLENYKALRFLKFIYTHPKFWIMWSKRQVLDYTIKVKLILVIAVLLCVFDIAWSIYLLSWFYEFISIVAVILCFPIYCIVANVIIFPLDIYLKTKIIREAKKKMENFPDLKVIAITGSMWKTTTKEILNTILLEKFNVLATEGTKNTPLWISRLILDELNADHQIFIVEMGAYNKGNITELCAIAWPNISVLTGITLQHLERFWSLDEIIDTKFEILEALWRDDFAVVNISTQWVQKWINEKKLDVQNIIKIDTWTPYSYKDNLWGIEFEIDWQKISTKILSNYIVETLQMCWEVWKHLSMDIETFKKWVNKIDFVDHRMQLLYNAQSNVYVIDDSFNGNIEGIGSILHLMENAPFTGRKIMIAWWVVELWDQSNKINNQIWRNIWKVADMVLLIEWPVGNAIEKWLSESWYSNAQIKVYSTPLSLHEDLKNITQNGDMIVFQNDLPDHYL